MTTSVTIATYRSESAPPGFECVAQIIYPSRASKKVGKMEAHPVIFFGSTEDGVGAKARQWWDDELAKAKRLAAARAATGEAARAFWAAKRGEA